MNESTTADQGANLQNFVRRTNENITKKSDTEKVYGNNAIFKKKYEKRTTKLQKKRTIAY